jgi:hypothetical protein
MVVASRSSVLIRSTVGGSTEGAERMAGTPTLPKNREGSGTRSKISEKAGPPGRYFNFVD